MWKNYILDNIDQVSSDILNINKTNKFAIYGDLGVGKTTLVKNFCKKLEVIDKVVSPTFTFINEYITKNQNKILHFDFFRMKNENEIHNIGCLDYFYSDHFCFVEWPERIEKFIPKSFCKIYLKFHGYGRKIKIRI